MLIDTHCHIHESYELPINEVLRRAHEADVRRMICVGTNQESSRLAISFAGLYPETAAAVGVHPHDTQDGYEVIAELAKDSHVVAIGEVGLDYFYTHSPRATQLAALEAQLEIAVMVGKPVIFHVREAFDDFWPILKNFPGIRGVLHSFTDARANLEYALAQGLYIGVNGISTFTKDEAQKELFDAIPLDNILFETDAPFLTPSPYRGKVNEPAYVRIVAEFHALRRGISLEEIAAASTHNATTLFALS